MIRRLTTPTDTSKVQPLPRAPVVSYKTNVEYVTATLHTELIPSMYHLAIQSTGAGRLAGPSTLRKSALNDGRITRVEPTVCRKCGKGCCMYMPEVCCKGYV
jgi:hypothetical protein